MNADDVREAVGLIRRSGRPASNIYTESAYSNIREAAVLEGGVVFSSMDHGVERLYYCCLNVEMLGELLGGFPKGEYVLEFMTREASENEAALKEAGFVQLARMKRMSARDCLPALSGPQKELYDENLVVEYPQPDKADEINRVLWDVFDTRVSHLLNDEEIKEEILKGEIIIHRSGEGDVDAILQTQINPKKFYINQVYNGTEKKVIHTMLQKRLQEYSEQGGKYAYAWVEEDNAASIRFHEKYGLKHDGMWNMVYMYQKA